MELADYLDGEGSSRFELAALIIHEGTLQSGHYIAVVRDGEAAVDGEEGSQWLVLNDTEVFKADEEAVLSIAKGVPIEAANPRLQKLLKGMEASATAYLLLYRKVEEGLPTTQSCPSDDKSNC